jgi:hypothetical protein
MQNALIRGFLGGIVILLLTSATALAIQGYKTIVPAQVERDTANITQADYAQARAKWQAQKIDLYEISVDDVRLQFRMRVDRTTGNLYLLKLAVDGTDESVDGLNTPLSGVTAKVYGAYSVDSLFDSINAALAGLSAGPQMATNAGSTDFRDVDVQFDSGRGYPVRFALYDRTTLSSHEITWRTKQRDLQIKDFTVIR